MRGEMPDLPACPRCGAACVRSTADPRRVACSAVPHYFAHYQLGAWREEPSEGPAPEGGSRC